eukprot:Opistho-2@67749
MSTGHSRIHLVGSPDPDVPSCGSDAGDAPSRSHPISPHRDSVTVEYDDSSLGSASQHRSLAIETDALEEESRGIELLSLYSPREQPYVARESGDDSGSVPLLDVFHDAGAVLPDPPVTPVTMRLSAREGIEVQSSSHPTPERVGKDYAHVVPLAKECADDSKKTSTLHKATSCTDTASGAISHTQPHINDVGRMAGSVASAFLQSPLAKQAHTHVHAHAHHLPGRNRSVLSFRAIGDDTDSSVPDVTAQDVLDYINKFKTGERKHVHDPVLDSEVEAQQGMRTGAESARLHRSSSIVSASTSTLCQKKCTILTDSQTFHEFNDLSELMGERGAEVLGKTRGTFWLDMYEPNAADMEFMEQVFGMHPLTIEDILTETTREKMEIYEQYIFFNLRSFSLSESSYDTEDVVESVYIAIYVNFVLSFHVRPSQQLPRIVRRVRAAKTLRPDWVLYTLLDEIVDSCVPIVEVAEAEVESINDLVLLLSGSEQSDMLRRIGNARKRLSDLHRRLHPKREMLAAMTTRAHKCLNPNTQLYLRDVLDHVLGMLLQIETSRETLNTSQSNYLAKVSIELADHSNNMSRVMKTLTIAATILMPLTLISGVFGMNVIVPGQVGDHGDSLGPFFGITGSMLCIALFLLFLFKRSGYI